MLKRIAHATDFSPQSNLAFRHALRLALDTRSRLDLLHVKEPSKEETWHSFPHVRETLVQWGLLSPKDSPADIEPKLGIHVSKIEINHHLAVGALSTFLMMHRPDLLVMATHGRQGINRWLYGSVAEEVLKKTRVPSMLIGPESHGFVGLETGSIRLHRILVPVAAEPDPPPSWTLKILGSLLSQVGGTSDSCELIHIAGQMPDILDTEGKIRRIQNFEGPVVETILRVANERKVDLIAMATAGHYGFLDASRGSTTSHVLPRAPCPVLVLPLMMH